MEQRLDPGTRDFPAMYVFLCPPLSELIQISLLPLTMVIAVPMLNQVLNLTSLVQILVTAPD